jgi:hypothetical protein
LNKIIETIKEVCIAKKYQVGPYSILNKFKINYIKKIKNAGALSTLYKIIELLIICTYGALKKFQQNCEKFFEDMLN